MTVKALIEALHLLENQDREIRIPFVLGSRIRFLEISGVSETPNSYSQVDWSND